MTTQWMPPVLNQVGFQNDKSVNIDLYDPTWQHMFPHTFCIAEYRVCAIPMIMKDRSSTVFQELALHKLDCFDTTNTTTEGVHYFPDEEFGHTPTPRLIAFQYVWNYLNGKAVPELVDEEFVEYRHLLWLLHCASFADYFGADQLLDSLEYMIKRLLINCPINRQDAVVNIVNDMHSQSHSGTFHKITDSVEWKVFHHLHCKTNISTSPQIIECINWCQYYPYSISPADVYDGRTATSVYCFEHQQQKPLVASTVRDVFCHQRAQTKCYYVQFGSHGIVGKYIDSQPSPLSSDDVILLQTFRYSISTTIRWKIAEPMLRFLDYIKQVGWYSPERNYTIGHVISQLCKYYVCIQQCVSLTPSQNPAHWLLLESVNFGGYSGSIGPVSRAAKEWDQDEFYKALSYVRYHGQLYWCRDKNMNESPLNNAQYWFLEQ